MALKIAALVLVGLFAGCKSSGSGVGTVSHALFCERLAATLCEAATRCCTQAEGTEDVEKCTEQRESQCYEWRLVLEDEELIGGDGEPPEGQIEHLRYQGERAATYLRELERTAERCGPIVRLPLASRKRSVPALYVSNLGAGDVCLVRDGCVEGLVCRLGAADDLVCRPPAELGERCSGDRDTCAAGLECRGEDFESERCAPALLADEGEPCAWAGDCKSGYCPSTPDDERCAACSDHAECALGTACEDGACVPAGTLEPRPDGARCRVDLECKSRDCWQGRCVEADANHFYCVNPLDRLFPPASS